MTMPNDTDTVSRPLRRDIADYLRARIMSRRGLMMLAAAWVLAGVVLNWNWLVAVGIAPVLVAVLPCLVMCGLGLCMNRMMGSSCESSSSAVKPDLETGTTARMDAGPSTGPVPVVRPQAVRRGLKQPAQKPRKRKTQELHERRE